MKKDVILKSCIALFCLLFHLIINVSAQKQETRLLKRCPVKTINFEQGLANNTTTSAVTDALGFTWIAAKTGLQRYNGYTLETVNPVIDKHVIIINSPVYLFALRNGLIWISCREGVLEYNALTNTFKKIIRVYSGDNINFSVIPVLQTVNGVWCLQYKYGLALYSSQTGTIVQAIKINNSFLQNVFDKADVSLNATFTSNQHSIFIYNGNRQILQADVQLKKLSLFKTDDVLSFAAYNEKLYLTTDSFLTRLNIITKKPEKKISLKNFIGENIFFTSAYFSAANRLLISLNSRVFEFDTACNYKYEFTDLNHNPILTFGFIRNMYVDRFNRIWLLTNDDIKRMQDFDIPFEHLMYADKNNFIRSLYYDEQKHMLLAGCYNGGIQLYDTSGNALWQTALITKTVNDIIDIEKLTNDNYLVITIHKGLFVLNLPSKKIKPLSSFDGHDSIDAVNINFIHNKQRVNDSTIYIISYSNVYSTTFHSNKYVSAKPLLPAHIGKINLLNCFLYARNKALYVCTTTGKIFIQDSLKNIHTIQIPGNYVVRNITEDAQQHIWVGTDKGLFVYNNKNQLIRVFNAQNGLLNDCIYAVVPVENKAAVYASSNLGLSYISLNESIINYTKESGLQGNEFNTQSATKTTQGKYYFGGVNGITAFYPSALINISDTPILNITKLVINDSSYNSSPGYWKGDSIKLKYSQNHIQFDFAALGLLNTNEYIYKYRLKEFESNWQTTHEPTGIKYVLQPGTYTFEITCSPVFSLSSIFKRTIIITVAPPYWQAWWFKTFIVLVAIAVIVLAVRQYLNNRYQKRLNILKLSQEVQLERERISHDLHDNLGAYAAAIASNISTIQTNNNSTNKEIFNQLKSNSQSIINQLNDTIWALNKEHIYLTAVSDRFKVFLQKIRPNYPYINIEIKESIINDELLSPANALHLFRMMQEAVNNALKHSGGNDIFIELASDKKWVVIIKDNGHGMPDESVILYGNGVSNIKTRSKAAGWNVQWISEPQNGTEVIITSTTN